MTCATQVNNQLESVQ